MNIPGALLSNEFLADVRRISNDMAERDPSRAFRFLQQVEDSFLILVDSPYLGSPEFYDSPILHYLRRHQIPKFHDYGIFYRRLASANGVNIWRVLHAKQDDFGQLESFADDKND